jgi:predicted metal-dependent hydrolase
LNIDSISQSTLVTNAKTLIDWPPPYRIQTSRRARNTFLKITPNRGLEIVVPHQKSKPNIDKLLSEKRTWIEKNYHYITLSLEASRLELPIIIECPALLESWHVNYQFIPHKTRVTLKQGIGFDHERVLSISGDTTNIALCLQHLKKWLMRHALATLSPWLKSLSLITDLRYNRIIIRGQTTLWGSCNTKKTISLNYKLLFLPRNLVEHVLLHELCHTKYLNHSKRFWQFLNTWDNQSHQNRQQLKKADGYLPRWVRLT